MKKLALHGACQPTCDMEQFRCGCNVLHMLDVPYGKYKSLDRMS